MRDLTHSSREKGASKQKGNPCLVPVSQDLFWRAWESPGTGITKSRRRLYTGAYVAHTITYFYLADNYTTVRETWTCSLASSLAPSCAPQRRWLFQWSNFDLTLHGNLLLCRRSRKSTWRVRLTPIRFLAWSVIYVMPQQILIEKH